MALETINREEFDRRLDQSTEQMRQKRLALEAQAGLMEDLIGRYSPMLERLEAEAEAATDESRTLEQRSKLRSLLTELAERTSAVAAAL
ncbi:MAG: hypothetical protein H7145_09810 [Akkermansiaceae bacterium]|nr:hypothetical protein [Armatimonadota bacterium]